MKTVCTENDCAGCMLCADICPKDAIDVRAGIEAYNAVIDETKCVECGLCHRICPQNELPEFRRAVEWRQGWSVTTGVRERSSSGGLATELSRSFIENGGEVCTCVLDGGSFKFAFFDEPDELVRAAGSKYVKSDPRGIYTVIKEKLQQGKKILVIGLPCQIAAVVKYLDGEKNLYTVDLICHGTPSPKVLERYLAGKGIRLDELKGIQFRKKDAFGLRDSYRSLEKKVTDEYTYTFLRGMTYTDNCYRCHYAQAERVSDITLGDSWGSELSAEERSKGISLVLCLTEKGRQLLAMSNLQLLPVDAEKAINANKQLQKPTQRPDSRARLIGALQKGVGLEWAMFFIAPRRGVRRLIKKLLPGESRGGI